MQIDKFCNQIFLCIFIYLDMKNSMIYIYIFVEKLRLNFRFKLNWVRSNEEFLKIKNKSQID